MALDSTVKKGIREHGIAGGLKDLISRVESGDGASDSGHYDPKLLPFLMKYNGGLGGISEDELGLIKELTPEEVDDMFSKYLRPAYKTAKGKLVEFVEPHYGDVLDDLEGMLLLNALESTPEAGKGDDAYKDVRGAKENAKKWRDIVEKNDYDAYVASASSPFVKDAMEKIRARDESILDKYMQKRADIEGTKYLDVIATDLPTLAQGLKNNDTGLISKGLDSDKVRGYLKDNIDNLKNDDKPEAYESAGLSYSNYLVNKEIEESKKKVKADLK